MSNILVRLTDDQHRILATRYGNGHDSRHLVENAIKECVEEETRSQAKQDQIATFIEALHKITMLRPGDALGTLFERAQIIAHDALHWRQ